MHWDAVSQSYFTSPHLFDFVAARVTSKASLTFSMIWVFQVPWPWCPLLLPKTTDFQPTGPRFAQSLSCQKIQTQKKKKRKKEKKKGKPVFHEYNKYSDFKACVSQNKRANQFQYIGCCPKRKGADPSIRQQGNRSRPHSSAPLRAQSGFDAFNPMTTAPGFLLGPSAVSKENHKR